MFIIVVVYSLSFSMQKGPYIFIEVTNNRKLIQTGQILPHFLNHWVDILKIEMSPKFPNDAFSYVLENLAWVGIAVRYEETLCSTPEL